jgi:hypothetical protein
MSREAKRIKTWSERCEEHPDHQERIITERMIQARMQEEIDELRQALETEQEPVLWLKTWPDGSVSVLKTKSDAFADHELEPLYTAPPKREWVGLTALEIYECWKTGDVVEAVEAKLKEKNHG